MAKYDFTKPETLTEFMSYFDAHDDVDSARYYRVRNDFMMYVIETYHERDSHILNKSISPQQLYKNRVTNAEIIGIVTSIYNKCGLELPAWLPIFKKQFNGSWRAPLILGVRGSIGLELHITDMADSDISFRECAIVSSDKNYSTLHLGLRLKPPVLDKSPKTKLEDAAFLVKNYKYEKPYILVWCANLPEDDIAWSVHVMREDGQNDTSIITEDEDGNPFLTRKDIMSYCDRTYGKDATHVTGWRGFSRDFKEVYRQYQDECTWTEVAKLSEKN